MIEALDVVGWVFPLCYEQDAITCLVKKPVVVESQPCRVFTNNTLGFTKIIRNPNAEVIQLREHLEVENVQEDETNIYFWTFQTN